MTTYVDPDLALIAAEDAREAAVEAKALAEQALARAMTPGPIGEPGKEGAAGLRGIQGERGTPGERGLAGDPGARGERGEAGERGLQGIQGERGKAGPRGLRGEAGKDGTGLRWRGPWDATVAYLPNDLVEYTGTAFIALAASTGTAPAEAGVWEIFAARGEQGDPGAKGDDGEQGVQGIQGDPGADGADGAGSSTTYSAENKGLATVSAGHACATHVSGVGFVAACAADGSKPAVGLLVADTAPGFAGDIQTDGLVTIADWTAVTGAASLTRGPYFLDPTTPGRLTATAPTTGGQVVQVVGYAVSPNDLDLSPANPIRL